MASQALYRKWRSQTFDEVIGQRHVTQTLVNALKLNRIAHAYLFSGPRGTGKTSTARLLAKAVNCLAASVEERPCNRCTICTAVNEGRLLDLIEIDAASNTGVDDIRDLRDKVNFRPNEARYKIYIIDEVHMLSKSAFNALLKTLEEPPEHVIFVLATTEPEKIPPTITSRCQRFDFRRIKLADIIDRLAFIVQQEGLQAEPAALEYIARQGGGSMRDAISLLDQLTAYGTETITLELVQRVLGTVASQSVAELVDALLARDTAAGLDVINRLVADGADPRQLAHEIVEYLRALMLVKLGNGGHLLTLPEEALQRITQQAARGDARQIVRAASLFNQALVEIKTGLLDIPQLPLELALVEAVSEESRPAPTEPQARPAPAAKAPAPPVKPKAAPPPVSSPPAAAPGKGVVAMQDVLNCLDTVLNDIERKNKIMAEALRNQCRLHQVTGNEIQFVTNDLMKQRFEKPQPQAAVNDAFSRALGQSVRVRFLSEKAVARPTDTQADDEELAALLDTARQLGGEVVE